MSVGRRIGYGIGGFTLSMAMVVLTAASLQFVVSSVWTSPQSFLVAFGTAMSISVVAIALPWTCLLKGLRNKAMVRGVWCQIYSFVIASVVALLVVLFW
jgi:hypothetical protein